MPLNRLYLNSLTANRNNLLKKGLKKVPFNIVHFSNYKHQSIHLINIIILNNQQALLSSVIILAVSSLANVTELTLSNLVLSARINL